MTEQPVDQTFVFADLAGYTALTDVHGDREAVDLLDRYLARMRDLVDEHSGREVKTIGDAVLIALPSAAQAVRMGLRAVREIGAQHGHPSVRVGMHRGSAIERDGDYLGRTVNIAARVSALAAAGEVLVTEEVRVVVLRDDPDVHFQAQGPRLLKGIGEPVAVFRAYEPGESGKGASPPLDPVCRMVVEPALAAGTLAWGGLQYHFCSLGCAQRFAENPKRYV